MEQPAPQQRSEPTTNDQTYLLRIWRTAADQPWRVTLRGANQATPHHFASLHELFAGLWGLVNEGGAVENDVILSRRDD